MDKTCEWCQKAFICGRSDQRFCADKCRSLHRNKKWRDRHKESELARNRAYQAEHRDYFNEIAAKRYREDPEKFIAKAREYRQANPEKVVETRAKSYEKHGDKARARTQAYRIANPKRMQVQHHNHTARQRGDFGRVEAEEWIALVEKYDHRCLKCGRQEPEIVLTIDHIIPVSKNGKHTIDNIQPLCKSCNSSKKQKILDFRNQGLHSTMAVAPTL